MKTVKTLTGCTVQISPQGCERLSQAIKIDQAFQGTMLLGTASDWQLKKNKPKSTKNKLKQKGNLRACFSQGLR
jgi:hypothetical protein